jgi:hypothetical protein
VKDRPNEDTIRRRLRELAEQSRRIRADLNDMIGGEERSPSGRFLHRQLWNRSAPVRSDDRRRATPRKPKKSG